MAKEVNSVTLNVDFTEIAETVQEVVAAFDKMSAAIERQQHNARVRRAAPYRKRGWNDLADVIENQDGKHK